MTKYEFDSKETVFLNHKNIAQSVDSDIPYNAIPSQELFVGKYNELSTKDNQLSNEISQLSDGISADVNKLSADLSGEIDNLSASLCGTVELSVEKLHSAINKLSDDLSGDIDNLSASVSGLIKLSVDSLQTQTTTLDKKADIISSTLCAETIALSTSLSNQVNAEFVHKAGDTINGLSVDGNLSVNSQAAFDGDVSFKKSLYIGSTTPETTTYTNTLVVGDRARAAGNDSFVWNGDNGVDYTSHGNHGTFNINAEGGLNGIYFGEESVSAIIDSQQEELSNTLSTYTNSKIDELSIVVDSKRPTKVSELENDNGYLISDDFDGRYDSTTKTIYLSAGNKEIEIDATAFIKDGMLSAAEFDPIGDVSHQNPPYIKLTFNSDAGKDPIWIPVKDLVDTYTANTEGISVADYKIGLDYSVVAKKNVLDAAIANIDVLSNSTIPAITSDAAVVSARADRIQAYVNELSGVGSNIGTIKTLSDAIDDAVSAIRGTMSLAGHITLKRGNSYNDNTLSGIFKYFNLAENNQLRTGNVYDVEITDLDETSGTDLATAYFDTADIESFRLAHKDLIIVHAHDKTFITLDELLDNVEILPAVRRFEHYELSNAVRDNFVWLSGNNNTSAIYDGHVGHAISGGNEFLGYNQFQELSVAKLSVSELSGYKLDVDQLSVAKLSASDLSVHDIDADDLSAENAAISYLSAYQLSVGTVDAGLTADNKFVKTYMIDISAQNADLVNGTGTLYSKNYSHAEGNSTSALGGGTHTEGYQTIAKIPYSHAEGCETFVGDPYAAITVGMANHAEGQETSALGNNANHAEGFGTLANATYAAHAEGGYTKSTGWYAHAEGEYTEAKGYASHAEGLSTVADGKGAHAEGKLTLAKGDNTFAAGQATSCFGEAACAFGYNTIVSGDTAVAFGNTTHAYGSNSIAAGMRSTAKQIGDVAIGQLVYASAGYAIAEGASTSALGVFSHSAGTYAVAKDNNAVAWSGKVVGYPSYGVTPYESHGQGTFNIDPLDGLSGFYIGEVNLSNVIHTTVSCVSALIELSAAGISSEVNRLCSEISNTVVLVLSVGKLQDQLTTLNSKVDDISSNLCSEIETLSTALSTEIDTLSTQLSNRIDDLSTSLSDTVSSLTSDLSDAISSKIFIDDPTTGFSDYSDLSVVKVTDEQYAELIGDGTKLLEGTTLYVISSDDLNVYGQRIINVAAPIENSDAATKEYVDTADADIAANVETLDEKIDNKLSSMTDSAKYANLLSVDATTTHDQLLAAFIELRDLLSANFIK